MANSIRKIRQVILVTVFVLTGSSTSAQVQAGNDAVNSKPVQGVRISWDFNSIQQLAPRQGRVLPYAGYPRVKRFSDGPVVCVYEAMGNGELIESMDEGATWSDPVTIFKGFYAANEQKNSARIHISNTEIIELQNGHWLAACNYRPQKEGIVPFSIVIARSIDKGKTWTQPEVIFSGGTFFKDGCWEPAFLQLPDGEVQVYFANEAPYTLSDEQEISVMRSTNNGTTWTLPQRASFRKGKRDGMPVPLISGNEILVAIEDNKVDPFKPYIVRTSIVNSWKYPVTGNSPQREYALETPLLDSVYGGAPYLAKLPSGEVVLSYQTTRGRSSEWELSTMEVAIGDSNGRGFGKLTQPFLLPVHKQAKWNSIALWDERTVVAASATNFLGNNIGAWMILGRIIPELISENRNVKVDGIIDETEWGNYLPVFVGHKGKAQLSAGIRHNDRFLFFGAKVNSVDKETCSSAANGVNIYIDAFNQSLQQPDRGVYKIWCSKNGRIRVYEGIDGKWKETGRRNMEMKVKKNSSGYDLELSVPFDLIKKKDRQPIRINTELLNYCGNGGGYNENIVNVRPDASNTWCEVRF